MRENHIHHGRDVGIFTFDNGMVVNLLIFYQINYIQLFFFLIYAYRDILRRMIFIIIE